MCFRQTIVGGAKVISQSRKIYASVCLLSKDFRKVFNVIVDNLNTYCNNVALYTHILANYQCII